MKAPYAQGLIYTLFFNLRTCTFVPFQCHPLPVVLAVTVCYTVLYCKKVFVIIFKFIIVIF